MIDTNSQPWKKGVLVLVIAALIGGVTLLVRNSRLTQEQAVPQASAGAVDADAIEGSNTAGMPGSVRSASLGSQEPSKGASTLREAEAQSNAQMRRLEGVWNAAREDSINSARMEREVAEAVDSPMVLESPSQPDQVEGLCKSSMCRIEATFPAGGDPTDWMTRMLLVTGATFQNATSQVVPGGDGKAKILIYTFAK